MQSARIEPGQAHHRQVLVVSRFILGAESTESGTGVIDVCWQAEGTDNSIDWLSKGQGGIAAATVLMPFAGISFLWFIGWSPSNGPRPDVSHRQDGRGWSAWCQRVRGRTVSTRSMWSRNSCMYSRRNCAVDSSDTEPSSP